MEKGHTVPKWVLISWPKIPQMPKIYLSNLFAQAQKFGISMKKKLFWAFVVRGSPQDLHMHTMTLTNPNSLAIAN